MRTLLTAAATFYIAPPAPIANSYWGHGGALVTTGGNDSTGNGSQAAPWATIKHAHDVLFNSYDLAGYALTFQLAVAPIGQQNMYDMGYNCSGRYVGQGGTFPQLVVGGGKPNFVVGDFAPVILQGDPTNPSGAFFYPEVGGGSAVSLTEGASLRVSGIGADTSRSQQDIFQAFAGAFLDVSDLSLGDAGYPNNSWSNDFSIGMNAGLSVSGNYFKNGFSSNHIQVGGCSWVYFNNNGDPGVPITVTFNNTTWNGNNGNCTILCDNSWAFMSGVNFAGAVSSGYSVRLYRNGVVETSGAKNIPGPSGQTSDGAPGNFYH